LTGGVAMPAPGACGGGQRCPEITHTPGRVEGVEWLCVV